MSPSVLMRFISSVALAAAAALVVVGPVQAQARDSARAATGQQAAQDTAAADTVPPPRPLHLAGTLILSGSLGRLSFGAFQAQSVDMSPLDSLGNPLDTQSFERTLGGGSATSAFVGLTYWASERWGGRVEAAWAKPQVQPSLDRAGEAYRFQHGGTAEKAAASFSLLSVTAVGLFRLPFQHPVYTPYALVGAGLRRYGAVSDTAALPAGARAAFANRRTVFVGLFGAGALVRLRGDRWLLQVEFQHRLAPTPIPGRGNGDIQRSDSLLIAFPGTAPTGDAGVDTTPSTRLSIGVAYALPLHRAAQQAKQEGGPGTPP
jgi:hypothetical protein